MEAVAGLVGRWYKGIIQISRALAKRVLWVQLAIGCRADTRENEVGDRRAARQSPCVRHGGESGAEQPKEIKLLVVSSVIGQLDLLRADVSEWKVSEQRLAG
jgi:hypothetical protein